MALEYVSAALRAQGIAVTPDWLQRCWEHLQQHGVHTPAVDHVYQQLLQADFAEIGAGVLPADLSTVARGVLEGPCVVQVEAVRDISESGPDATERRLLANPRERGKRCLRLECTDGQRRVPCLEYRPCPSLDHAQVGMKLQLRNVNVRRGLLLLVEESVAMLGGSVAAKAAAEAEDFRRRCALLKGKPYLVPGHGPPPPVPAVPPGPPAPALPAPPVPVAPSPPPQPEPPPVVSLAPALQRPHPAP
eukprot:EG_transcript_25458